MKSNRYADFSPSRRLWNQFFTGAVWIAAAFVIVLVVGIIGMGDMGKKYARRLSAAGWR